MISLLVVSICCPLWLICLPVYHYLLYSVCLFFRLSLSLFFCLSVCSLVSRSFLLVYVLSIYLSFWLSVILSLSLCLSVCPICQFVILSICCFVSLSFPFLCLSSCVSLSVYQISCLLLPKELSAVFKMWFNKNWTLGKKWFILFYKYNKNHFSVKIFQLSSQML